MKEGVEFAIPKGQDAREFYRTLQRSLPEMVPPDGYAYVMTRYDCANKPVSIGVQSMENTPGGQVLAHANIRKWAEKNGIPEYQAG